MGERVDLLKSWRDRGWRVGVLRSEGVCPVPDGYERLRGGWYAVLPVRTTAAIGPFGSEAEADEYFREHELDYSV